MRLQLLHQLFAPHGGQIQFSFHLPEMSVANRVFASVVSEEILSFEHRAAESEAFAHGEADEGAAAASVSLREVFSDVFEVQMFQEQQQRRQEDPGHQEKERRQELLEG